MDSKVFEYGNGMRIQVPEGATRAVVRVRHTHSVQSGSNETRTITAAGERLCGQVMMSYKPLIDFLADLFEEPTIFASPWPRAILTAYFITRSSQIFTDNRLKADVSVKKAPAPAGSYHENLYAHWKAEGLTVGQMIKLLAANPRHFGPQEVEQALAHNEAFLRGPTGHSHLVVAFDHEPIISLLAAKHGAPANQLGLEECQAFVFFLDGDDSVISVQKFTPPATLASAG